MSVREKIRLGKISEFIILFLCLIVAGFMVPATAEPATAVSSSGSPPEIRVFKAEPLLLRDGEAATYYFEVWNATRIQIVEAGDVIKEISGIPSATYNGSIKGRTTYLLRTSDSKSFTTMLMASNRSGNDSETLALYFASNPPAWTEEPTTGRTSTDNRTMVPEWLSPSSEETPFPSVRQITPVVSAYPPQFAQCSQDCEYCLKPDEAKSRGFINRCTAQPCYYSPDDQQKWYCYSKPATVWCCNDGNVYEATKEQCAQVGGQGYATEKEAIDVCQPMGYCCKDGKVGETTRSQCAQVDGIWYSTQDEALKVCQQTASGYCCLDGKVGEATRSQCSQYGGSWYSKQNEAIQACQQMTSGYCCTNGQVYGTTRSQCAQYGGYWSTSQSEVSRYCQQSAACWCCYGGKVFQTTQSQCAQYGGNCYSSQAEANRYCQQASSCWCCSNGQVYQTTQSQCSQNGGTCYYSQTEASRYCQQSSTCWCCYGGKVFQSTKLQCSQYGGTCYSTQSQATAGCNVRLYIK